MKQFIKSNTKLHWFDKKIVPDFHVTRQIKVNTYAFHRNVPTVFHSYPLFTVTPRKLFQSSGLTGCFHSQTSEWSGGDTKNYGGSGGAWDLHWGGSPPSKENCWSSKILSDSFWGKLKSLICWCLMTICRVASAPRTF